MTGSIQPEASFAQVMKSELLFIEVSYLAEAVEQLKRDGVSIKKEELQHMSPLGWEHINLIGDFHWNVKRVPPNGQLRPLRTKQLGVHSKPGVEIKKGRSASRFSGLSNPRKSCWKGRDRRTGQPAPGLEWTPL